MPTESDELRQLLRNWATGVTVVTASDGRLQHGMTVSSFTSISLEPPRLLVSLEKTSRTHELALRTGFFGITILADNQQSISDRFAGRDSLMDDQRFDGLATETLKSKSPFLVGGLAFLDCQIVHTYDSGTNTLLIGDVIALQSGNPGKPLLYYDRDYRTLGG